MSVKLTVEDLLTHLDLIRDEINEIYDHIIYRLGELNEIIMDLAKQIKTKTKEEEETKEA